jgi:hypothetical protein
MRFGMNGDRGRRRWHAWVLAAAVALHLALPVLHGRHGVVTLASGPHAHGELSSWSTASCEHGAHASHATDTCAICHHTQMATSVADVGGTPAVSPLEPWRRLRLPESMPVPGVDVFAHGPRGPPA